MMRNSPCDCFLWLNNFNFIQLNMLIIIIIIIFGMIILLILTNFGSYFNTLSLFLTISLLYLTRLL